MLWNAKQPQDQEEENNLKENICAAKTWNGKRIKMNSFIIQYAVWYYMKWKNWKYKYIKTHLHNSPLSATWTHSYLSAQTDQNPLDQQDPCGFRLLIPKFTSGFVFLQVPAAAAGSVRNNQVDLHRRGFEAGQGAGHGWRYSHNDVCE